MPNFIDQVRARVSRGQDVTQLWTNSRSQPGNGFVDHEFTRDERTLTVRIDDAVNAEPEEEQVRLAWDIWASLNFRFERPPPTGDDSIVICCTRGPDYSYVTESSVEPSGS